MGQNIIERVEPESSEVDMKGYLLHNETVRIIMTVNDVKFDKMIDLTKGVRRNYIDLSQWIHQILAVKVGCSREFASCMSRTMTRSVLISLGNALRR